MALGFGRICPPSLDPLPPRTAVSSKREGDFEVACKIRSLPPGLALSFEGDENDRKGHFIHAN